MSKESSTVNRILHFWSRDFSKSDAVVTGGNAALASESEIQMRKLRLWHWRKVVAHRKQQDHFEDRLSKNPRQEGLVIATQGRDFHKDVANFHLSAVQTLNDLFPVGDYAEADEIRFP